MSHLVVPDWHLNHQRQEQLQGEESNRSSHVHNQLQNNPTAQLVPMSDYDIAELTWENGQLAMHGLGGSLNSGQTKPTWSRTCETLESIVHQATKTHNENPNLRQEQHQTLPNIGSIVPDSDGKWVSTTTTTSSEHDTRMGPLVMKKRTPPDSEYCPRGSSSSFNGGSKDEQEQLVNRSACASASVTTICRDSSADHNDIETSMRTWASFQSPRSFTDKTTAKGSVNFCRDNDTTVMTWSSYQSPESLKTISTDDHQQDSACQEGSVQQQKFKNENQDDDRETKTDHMVRSHSTSRRSRAAAIHNQSERKRRDRINQKMKALQKLVPGANKTDKASILDEVIKHLKQLQAQIQMMTARNIPQMMMPMGTQQQLQMSLLQRMGMGVGLGMGMGMLDMSTMAPSPLQSLPHHLIHSTQPVAASNPAFVSPPFLVPQMIAAHSSTRTNPDAASMPPLADPYCAFLAQQMNMELYNKMAALHQQQLNQSTQATTRGPSQPNHHLQAD